MKYTLIIFLAISLFTPAREGMCLDGRLCYSAAESLMLAANTYSKAERDYQSAQDEFDNACGYYGFSKNDQLACGQNGYIASELSRAEAKLKRTKKDISIFLSGAITSCAPENSTQNKDQKSQATPRANTKKP